MDWERLSVEFAFMLTADVLSSSAEAPGDRDCEGTNRLASAEAALRLFCREPCEANRSKLVFAVAELKETRRSSALARWRGCP